MKLVASLAFVAMSFLPQGQSPKGLSFTATLDSIRISARPGQVVTRQFRLTLDPDQPQTHFKARVEDWWRSEDGRESVYAEAGTLQRSCAKWVSVNPVESSVIPGGTLVVRLTITVPVEPRAGGYWCALTVDEVADPLANPGIGVRFVASVSTGIFVNLDPIERAATITDLQIGTDDAVLKVHNQGNTPVGVEGRIEFHAAGAQGSAVSVEIPHTTILTEPIARGVVTVALPGADILPSGHYVARVILDFGADHLIGAERDVDIQRGAANRVSLR